MADMHPYEALRIALQEARDERDDWRESATRASGESCGDERHCTCVGPLRKELRDAKAKLADPRRVLLHETEVVATKDEIAGLKAKLAALVEFNEKLLGRERKEVYPDCDFCRDSGHGHECPGPIPNTRWAEINDALAAAKVQP